ncbi:hypothetical protein D9611_014335 [Ephemerocybe angulata]|uniref:Uncharacterized protein n=1 Tax=Ephemerocybe angulata TaxID=980116 RepID=A0A8H5FEJ6_9AGAR|nr:hypothetical protein D9611_014335 [Tulosesus angulatus]
MDDHEPAGPPLVSRDKTAPFLIRTFAKVGGFHRLGLFEDGTLPTTDEHQLFTPSPTLPPPPSLPILISLCMDAYKGTRTAIKNLHSANFSRSKTIGLSLVLPSRPSKSAVPSPACSL